MRPYLVVIARVRLQNLAQMHLAQDNDVVYTLTPDRSDQPFGKAVLPGRGWRGRLVPDAHGAQSACDDAAIDPIPIADEVTRRFIPRKCLRYLTRNPFGGRICCDVDPDQVSAASGISPRRRGSSGASSDHGVELQISRLYRITQPCSGAQATMSVAFSKEKAP